MQIDSPHMMSRIKTYASKIYYFYKYNTPLGVLSLDEAIAFNFVAFCSMMLMLYWIVAVLPALSMRVIEATYYYLTGNTISVGVLALVYFSRKLFWHASSHSIPRHGTNITRMGRQQFAL